MKKEKHTGLKEQNAVQKPIVIVLLAVISTFLWGSAHPVIKIGYELFHIQESAMFEKILFAGVRFTLAGILVLAVAWGVLRRFPIPKRKAMGDIVSLGLVQTTVEYVFFYIGLSHTTATKSSIINATAAFIAVLLAHFFYANDRLTVRKGLGCLLGFAGIVVMNVGGGLGGGFTLSGEGFLLLAAASFAVGSLISKRAAQKEDSMVVTGWQLFVGGAVLVLIGLFGGARFAIPSLQALLLLAYLALLSAVAFTLWTILLKNNSIGKISVYNFLTPVFGVILSALLLGEPFSWKNVAALTCVCAGILIVNLPGLKKKKGN